MKWYECHLNSETDEHKNQPANNGLGSHELRNSLPQVGHVQRTRCRIKVPDTQ